MKVLLVSPINRTYVIMPNIGLGYLAAALRKDSHEVKILHCAKERMSYPKYAEFLKKDKFDIVGFQVFSYDLDSVKEHARLLKSINPSACIVVAGHIHPARLSIRWNILKILILLFKARQKQVFLG